MGFFVGQKAYVISMNKRGMVRVGEEKSSASCYA
jgi:hypothetical protein